MLELGCGAGRLTAHLCEIAESVHGIDISPSMVAYCRQTYPNATFSEADLRDLSAFEAEPFAAVFAPFNVLGVLDDAERKRSARRDPPGADPRRPTRLLRAQPGLGTESARAGDGDPGARLRRQPRRRGEWHRAPAAAAFATTAGCANTSKSCPEYAILNDSGHDYSLLHYYISHDGQARQLAEHGFGLVECLDLDAGSVTAGELAPACYELHYVARRGLTA